MADITTPKKRGRPPKVQQIVEESIQTSAALNQQSEHVMEDVFEPAPQAAPIAPSRPEMRPTMREEDPRARAARRAAELRDHRNGDMDEGIDEFYIDPADIPEGWSYEWKRRTVLGAEDPAYQVALARAGWEPVPTSRHPSYMPMGGDYPFIERKGMILMERPLEITDRPVILNCVRLVCRFARKKRSLILRIVAILSVPIKTSPWSKCVSLMKLFLFRKSKNRMEGAANCRPFYLQVDNFLKKRALCKSTSPGVEVRTFSSLSRPGVR